MRSYFADLYVVRGSFVIQVNQREFVDCGGIMADVQTASARLAGPKLQQKMAGKIINYITWP